MHLYQRTVAGIVLAAIACSALFVGCDTGIVTNPKDIVFPDSGVSYTRSVSPLFDLSCAFAGCHDDQTKAGGMTLKSYIGALERPGVIVPFDSSGSVMIQILRAGLPHSAYPINQLVNENHRRGIAIWIQEGARNN